MAASPFGLTGDMWWSEREAWWWVDAENLDTGHLIQADASRVWSAGPDPRAAHSRPFSSCCAWRLVVFTTRWGVDPRPVAMWMVAYGPSRCVGTHNVIMSEHPWSWVGVRFNCNNKSIIWKASGSLKLTYISSLMEITPMWCQKWTLKHPVSATSVKKGSDMMSETLTLSNT